MWTTVYDENGVVQRKAWPLFSNQIRSQSEPVFKVEFLNADMEPVGSRIHSGCSCISDSGEVQNLVSDGNIDVDTTRGTRRTAELTLLNPTAEFTPATEDFEAEGAWVGKIYLNRFVRTWRGVHVGTRHLYVPTGTFMVDTCEVIVEENMSLVNLTLSDFWKKLTKSYYGNNRKYDKNSTYNSIITDILSSAGVKRTGKFGAVLDRLSERNSDDKRVNWPVKVSRGDSRGELLKTLTRRWGIDSYFDPMGIFRTEDRRTASDRRQVWHFKSGEFDNAGRHGGLVSVKRSFNDDNLYNHVIIIGTGNEKQVFKAYKKDTRPNSKTNVATIGDRVFLLETEKVSNQNQANRALKQAWEKRFQLSEIVTAETICNPALEGDDKVRITEKSKAKIDDAYRLVRFNIPMITSRQSIEATNIIYKDDLDNVNSG